MQELENMVTRMQDINAKLRAAAREKERKEPQDMNAKLRAAAPAGACTSTSAGGDNNDNGSEGPLNVAKPSDRSLRTMRSHGPSQWVVVKPCGWNGDPTPDGERRDVFAERLHAAGCHFVHDTFTYYVRLPPGVDRDAYCELLQQTAIDMNEERPCRLASVKQCMHKRLRSRLTTNFHLITIV